VGGLKTPISSQFLLVNSFSQLTSVSTVVPFFPIPSHSAAGIVTQLVAEAPVDGPQRPPSRHPSHSANTFASADSSSGQMGKERPREKGSHQHSSEDLDKIYDRPRGKFCTFLRRKTLWEAGQLLPAAVAVFDVLKVANPK
jgi:hypothetical protein